MSNETNEFPAFYAERIVAWLASSPSSKRRLTVEDIEDGLRNDFLTNGWGRCFGVPAIATMADYWEAVRYGVAPDLTASEMADEIRHDAEYDRRVIASVAEPLIHAEAVRRAELRTALESAT